MSAIEFSFTLSGDVKMMEACAAYRRAIPRTAVNAIRRVLRRRITVIKKRMRTESGLGMSIWGKKGAGLDKLVTLIRPTGSEDAITTGVKLKGLPRIIEEGGTILPHPIKAKNAPRLAFAGTGAFSGKVVFPKVVNHPGARVRPHGIAASVLRGSEMDILREVNDSIAKLKQKLFKAA